MSTSISPVSFGMTSALSFDARREQREDLLEVEPLAEGRLGRVRCPVTIAVLRAVPRRERRRQFAVEVVGGVGEGGEDQHLPVAGVDGARRPCRVMRASARWSLRSCSGVTTLPSRRASSRMRLAVVPEVAPPGLDVHVIQVDLDLRADRAASSGPRSRRHRASMSPNGGRRGRRSRRAWSSSRPERLRRRSASTLREREPERLDRALQALEQVDRHELLECPARGRRCRGCRARVPALDVS